MANRAMNAKFERAKRQRIALGQLEYAKPDYVGNDNLDGQYREMRELIAAVPASRITKCEPGKASGLHKDYGVIGKRGARRYSMCYGNGERKVTKAADYYERFAGFDEPWVLFRPV